MKNTYSRQEALKRLGLKNMFSLLRLEKRYPEAFVTVKQESGKLVEYDKAVLDRFAEWRERFKESNSIHSKA